MRTYGTVTEEKIRETCKRVKKIIPLNVKDEHRYDTRCRRVELAACLLAEFPHQRGDFVSGKGTLEDAVKRYLVEHNVKVVKEKP